MSYEDIYVFLVELAGVWHRQLQHGRMLHAPQDVRFWARGNQNAEVGGQVPSTFCQQ